MMNTGTVILRRALHLSRHSSSLIPPNIRHLSTQPAAASTPSNYSNEIVLSYLKDENEQSTIAKIALNRPYAANAMGRTMISQLRDVICSLNDPDVRCVVLSSSSQKVFSAGADLRERASMSQSEAQDFVDSLRQTFDDLAQLPVPVLAAVEGVALGGGAEIALAADIRVASSSARFAFPETGLAIVPGAGGTQRLPRLIGAARAMELIVTGRRIDAATAAEYGLVQRLAGVGGAEEMAIDMAKMIAGKGPIAIRMAKRAIRMGMEAYDFETALSIEKECYARTIPTSDRLEGLAAFREGRPPIYKGE